MHRNFVLTKKMLGVHGVPCHLQWRNSTMSIQRAIIIATTFTFFIQAIVWHTKSKIATFNWLCGNCKLWNGRFGMYLLCLGFSQPLASLSGCSLCLLWTPRVFSLNTHLAMFHFSNLIFSLAQNNPHITHNYHSQCWISSTMNPSAVWLLSVSLVLGIAVTFPQTGLFSLCWSVCNYTFYSV